MLVPLPRAASSRLMSFLTFHISIWRAWTCQRMDWGGPAWCIRSVVGLSQWQWRWQHNSRSSRPRWHWDRCSSWAKGAESKAGREGGDCRRVPLLSADVREVYRWFCWGSETFPTRKGVAPRKFKVVGLDFGRGLHSNSFMLRRRSLGLGSVARWSWGGEWVRGTSAGESSLEAEPIRSLPTRYDQFEAKAVVVRAVSMTDDLLEVIQVQIANGNKSQYILNTSLSRPPFPEADVKQTPVLQPKSYRALCPCPTGVAKHTKPLPYSYDAADLTWQHSIAIDIHDILPPPT